VKADKQRNWDFGMLTDVSIRKTVATTKRQEIPDKQMRGLYLI